MNNPNSSSKPYKKRSSYGTSRKSAMKKSFSQEQVCFSGPVSSDPVVGIVGGGMSGLVCALYLEKRGIRSTVFDTGLHGLGGRMGTRVIDPESLIFDHAAQFFTVSDPRFAELVEFWMKEGIVQEWQGTIGELEAGGHFKPLPSCPPRYIGVNGMRPLAESILSQTQLVNVVRPCWVSTLEAFNGMWHLSEKGKHCGQFDAVVIAHNGKCANRLLASSGLPLIARQMKRLGLSSIWALLAAFRDPLPIPTTGITLPFEGAFVKGVESISWMSDNSKKLLSSHGNGPHCWTFLSTAAFGKQNKVPQESIPNATAEKVKEAMLAGVECALGIPKSSLQKPTFTRLQLWGAALPTNSPNVPCIFDPHGRAGICGDWLLGSSMEAAALSGMALADQIADYFQNGWMRPDEFAVGLGSEFQPLKGHDIGQFPGLQSEEQVNDAQAIQLIL
ncbi:OLC1v1000986C1 [Oldenlandia corymbosa var. corymbosa]|uniref:OLC1v1000986C1 n=1 Tax=Oldenlandia corymbosa var. corymbosa TaxID=529605 RepID=A0AAV1D6W2_OLDCO|nr:OLC1v1000986C1 [Oldenlandia corymbosa var. corymbosa]